MGRVRTIARAERGGPPGGENRHTFPDGQAHYLSCGLVRLRRYFKRRSTRFTLRGSDGVRKPARALIADDEREFSGNSRFVEFGGDQRTLLCSPVTRCVRQT